MATELTAGACSDRARTASRGAARRAGRQLIRLLLGAAVALGSVTAAAHWERADEVISEIRSPKVRDTFDIVEVARHENVPRLLVIRVGPGWHQASAPARRTAAEQWRARWRLAVPQGIVAVVDHATDGSLVNFSAHGHAILKDTPAPSPGYSDR